jgi:hypothetical protein
LAKPLENELLPLRSTEDCMALNGESNGDDKAAEVEFGAKVTDHFAKAVDASTCFLHTKSIQKP